MKTSVHTIQELRNKSANVNLGAKPTSPALLQKSGNQVTLGADYGV